MPHNAEQRLKCKKEEAMKKGMIVYVTHGKNDLMNDQVMNLAELKQELNVQSLRLATTEDDLAEAWWRLIAGGMHQVSCISAHYHAQDDRLEVRGGPIRLAG
jgi:membrane-bound ClpP family serine protease